MKHKTEEELFSAATMTQRADYSQFETECLNNETTQNEDLATLAHTSTDFKETKFDTPEKKKNTEKTKEMGKKKLSLQSQLKAALGTNSAEKCATLSEEAGDCTPQSRQDLRSRTSSLRNGETSKAIDHLDLEAHKMTEQECEDYLRFCDKRDAELGFVTKRDRKASSEFFKTESERLDKIMKKQQTPPKSKFAKEPQQINAP